MLKFLYEQSATDTSRGSDSFCDPENCQEFMVKLRWPDGSQCPRADRRRSLFGKCEGLQVLRQARADKAKFSLKVGTIFEDSPIGLEKWLPAMWMLVNCKNGISSWEIHRAIGVTQKTAWFMLQRGRLAMQDD